VPAALNASRAPSAEAPLNQANQVASQDGINATPSFLIGKTGGVLRQFQPSELTAAPFAAALDQLLGAPR
jgi:protein-disulfide isomerase